MQSPCILTLCASASSVYLFVFLGSSCSKSVPDVFFSLLSEETLGNHIGQVQVQALVATQERQPLNASYSACYKQQ